MQIDSFFPSLRRFSFFGPVNSLGKFYLHCNILQAKLYSKVLWIWLMQGPLFYQEELSKFEKVPLQMSIRRVQS